MPRPLPRVLRADLAAGLPELGADPEGRDRHVVWAWRGVPLGADVLPPAAMPPRALADRAANAVADAVAARLAAAGAPPPPPGTDPLAALDAVLPAPPPVPAGTAVVVCTRDRPAALARCLASVRAAAPGTEVVVVDNGPDDATRAVAEGLDGVTYVAEPRPGLSAARNAALAATGAALLAFVDDDVVVEPGWLGWLCAPFADPAVGATCGLVLPAALDTEAQLAFETVLGGLGRGFVPRRADRSLLDGRLRAAPVWDLGAGANMAVRRAALDAVGAFDERLGAGAAGCSEDSELWHRLLAAGWAVVYEPASVVEHEHRRTWPELERQAHAYLRGHVAALFVQFARTRHPGELVRAFARLPAFLARVAVVEASAAALARLRLAIREAPPRPVAAELRGYARGLAHLPLALAPPRSPYKAPLGAFLRRNPFPHPLTEGFFYREKMRAIHRITPDAPIARVLEVGGGRSGMGHRLFPRARITNTDLDPSHATAPENQHERVTFQPADATALPFADASFDAVTMFDLLEHVPDDRAAAAEAMRVVRPGGWVLVSTPNLRWRSPYHRWMRRISPTTEEMMAQWEHVRLGYDRAALEALFGRPPETTAEFITPVTVVGHDVAFSRLPGKVRRAVLVALAPVIWAGYWLQGRHGEGTETAAAFRRPPA